MKVQLRQGSNWFRVEADEVKIDGVTTTKKESVVTKPKYEEGKWYVDKRFECIFLFNGNYDKDDRPLGYGFDCFNNNFRNSSKLGWHSIGVQATKEQVENSFREFFKKIGFKRGVKFRSVPNGGVYTFTGNFDFIYLSSHEEVYNRTLGLMFKKGKFATIVRE